MRALRRHVSLPRSVIRRVDSSLILLQEKEHFIKKREPPAVLGLPWFEIPSLLLSRGSVWESMQLATQNSLSEWS